MGQTTDALGMFPVGRTRAAQPDEVPLALVARLDSLQFITLEDADTPPDTLTDTDPLADTQLESALMGRDSEREAQRVIDALSSGAPAAVLTVKVKTGSTRRPPPQLLFVPDADAEGADSGRNEIVL